MSEMPERIWVGKSNHEDGGWWEIDQAEIAAWPHWEYVRADLVADLVKALEQARLYIERDEVAHGRQFGDGNAIRAALSRIAEAKGGK